MQNIKDIKPTFEFVGTLKDFKDKLKKDGTVGGKELVVYDKDMCSEVSINIWFSDEAKYWSTEAKRMIVVKDNVANEMVRVRNENIGIPVSYNIIGTSSNVVYTNNDLIKMLTKIPKNTKIKVEGSVDITEYKGRPQRNYNLKKIHLLSAKDKTPSALKVTMPMVVKKSDAPMFRIEEYKHILPVLVKTKLKGGTYTYKPTKLAFDKQYAFNGAATTISCEQINVVMSSVFKDLTDYEYAVMNVVGRLKIGTITRKPEESDLNPMDLALFKLQGADFVKEKLKSMDEISIEFDDLVFEIVDFSAGCLAQKIEKSELNLDAAVTTSDVSGSNPMSDLIKTFSSQQNKEPEVESVTVPETPSLEKLVAEEEEKTVQSDIIVANTEEEEDFPF